MTLELVTAPILTLPAEAVVNRANMGLQYASGVCAEIFNAAGKLPLQRACIALGRCDVGQAVVTEGYALKAKYIIHTVPPRWCGGKHGEDALLGDCYRNVLRSAEELGIRSIAIPFLSEDRCGYPDERGLSVAKKEILSYPYRDEMTVYLSLPERLLAST